MNLGELQIPKIEIEPFAFVHDYQTRLFVQYADIVEKTDLGKALVQALTSDQRVINLGNKMISRGSGAQRFEVKTLAMWCLWCANEFGKETVERYLRDFLKEDEIEVINALWVLGIEVDEPIELDDGYIIQSAKGMPDSRDKELFLQRRFQPTAQPSPVPAVAITKACRVKKIFNDQDPADDQDLNQEFWNVGRRLHDISLILNVLNNVSCLPYYSTSYPSSGTPFGPFGGSGGGSSLYDVMGHSSTKISSQDRVSINALMKSYESLGDPEKVRIRRILFRLSQAKRRVQIEDKILDLGITMEMLLLQDNRNNDQLSLSFRLRGSWLLGISPENRIEIYRQLRDIYNYRSQVAHSGVLCKGDAAKIEAVRNAFPMYQSFAENICRKIIQNGKPDWDKVVLNAISQVAEPGNSGGNSGT